MCETQLKDMEMQPPCPNTPSYWGGWQGSISLYGNSLQHLPNISTVYPTFALLIKLLIKAINSPNTKLQ